MILGHCHPAVVVRGAGVAVHRAAVRRAEPLEAEFAEMLVGALPWIESIRDRPERHGDGSARGPHRPRRDRPAPQSCASSATTTAGSTRCSSTGRRRRCPSARCRSPPASRRPPPPTSWSANGTTSIRWLRHWRPATIACVVMEPVMCNTGLIAPAPGYLEGVSALCAEHGALLVIDEVITGFRFGLTGAQGHARRPR